MKYSLPFNFSNIMKSNIYFTIIFILITGLSSCYKSFEPITSVGFDCKFDKASSGLSILDVGKYEDLVHFKGEIIINEGEIKIELVNPKGVIQFSDIISYPDKIEINETYDAMKGYWKLRYESNSGNGLINIQISEH